jgi:hypothetical protein
MGDLVRDCDIGKMSRIPPVDFSGLSEKEREEVFQWASGCIVEEVPPVIAEYVEKCK